METNESTQGESSQEPILEQLNQELKDIREQIRMAENITPEIALRLGRRHAQIELELNQYWSQHFGDIQRETRITAFNPFGKAVENQDKLLSRILRESEGSNQKLLRAYIRKTGKWYLRSNVSHPDNLRDNQFGEKMIEIARVLPQKF